MGERAGDREERECVREIEVGDREGGSRWEWAKLGGLTRGPIPVTRANVRVKQCVCLRSSMWARLTKN